MDTRKPGRENVYAAAEAWVERALKSDDSLFTPGRRIWTTEWLDELHRRFLDSPDVSDISFWDKLERQLTGSPPEAYQLMAEVLYMHFIVVSRQDSTGVQSQLQRVLNWSPQPVAIPSELAAGLKPGIANPGQGYHRYRPHQVGFVIEFASQWKHLKRKKHQRLLDDPWAFKDFVMQTVELQSILFRDHYVNPRMQQQALLHLVHPGTFEPIISVKHKEMIAATFEELVEDSGQDLDRKLQEIRSKLEAKYGEGFDFYQPEIRSRWDDDSDDARTVSRQRLTRLKAKGFRSLAAVDVPLGPLTVLVGPNGSGKTNVLGVLRFLASTVQFDLAAAIDAAGGYLRVQRQDGRGPSSRVVLGVQGIVTTHASLGAPDEYELKFYRSASDRLIREESFSWKRTPGSGRLTVKDTQVEFGTDDMDEGDRETRQLANRQTTGLATLPDWSDAEGGEGIRLLAQFLSDIRILEPDMRAARQPARIIPGRLADDASNLAAALHNLSLSEPDSFAILVDEVRECLPGLDAIEFELLGGPSRGVMVVLRERGVRSPVELADASFGTVRLLALLTALHETDQPSFTAIEEADHGLHPYALDLLVERLRATSEHTQLLVTTHAPTFVNRLTPEELVVCDRDPATGASEIPALPSREIARKTQESARGLGELWFAGAVGGVPG